MSVKPYFKIRKTDVANFSRLHEGLAQLSDSIKQSEQAFLYRPADGKLHHFIEMLNHTNVPFNVVSETQLYVEGK
jgi:hypothetical protein